MMMTDKKKPATLIIAKMRKDKPDEEAAAPMSPEGAENDDSMAKESAAEELLKAIESKSAKAIVEAFDSMMELCQGEAESEQE